MKRIILVGSLFAFVCILNAQETPRMDFSLQYDYVRSSSNSGPATSIVNGQLVTFNAGAGNNNLNGGGGQYGYNFNKWISGIVDVYAVHLGNSFGRWTDPVTGLNYNGGRLDLTSIQYQFGPRFYVRKWQRFTPFAEFFLGGANASASIPINLSSVTAPTGSTITPVTTPNGQTLNLVTAPNGQIVAITNTNGQILTNPTINVPVPLRGTNFTCNRVLPNGTCNTVTVNSVRAQSSQNVFAYNVGGGLDIPVNHYISFRPIEVDMQYTKFSQLRGFGGQNQYNFRYTTGIVFTFGKID
jgi:hypothetical protein